MNLLPQITLNPSSRAGQVLMRYSPIASSLAVHAIILLLALTTYTVGKQVVSKTQEQTIVPDAMIVEGAPVGGIPSAGLGDDPMRKSASDDSPQHADSDAWKRPSKALESAVMSGPDDSTSAIGSGSSRIGGVGVGSGIAGDGGNPTPFGGTGSGGGIAPKTSFMGTSGNAKKVVYVCDASGSMADRLNLLTQELYRSVDELKPIQSFNVILFGHQTPIMLANRLVPANREGESHMIAFKEKIRIGRGGSDPVASLRLAFMQQPELIYLFTDGDFIRLDDSPKGHFQLNDLVVEEIRRLNRDKHVRVNTIAFTSREPDVERNQGYVGTLKKIADEHGGNFRILASRELQKYLESVGMTTKD